MARTHLAAMAAFTILLTSAVSAQSPPDFSGVYRPVNAFGAPAPGRPGGPPPGPRAGGPPATLVNLVLSLGLALVMAVIYWQTLAPLGRLLHRRETKILATVSVEVE